MGQATSLRALELPGAVQLHSAIPALGAAGFLLHITQQCNCGPAGNCCRCARQSLYSLVVLCCVILFTSTCAGFGEQQGSSRTLGRRCSPYAVHGHTLHQGQHLATAWVSTNRHQLSHIMPMLCQDDVACTKAFWLHAGHCYYFLEDVYPRMTGRRPLKTPGAIKALFPEAGIGFMRTRPAAAQPAFPAPGVVPPPGAQH